MVPNVLSIYKGQKDQIFECLRDKSNMVIFGYS